ncbi:ribonuclease E/G [Parvularcula marina]|uniref:ribonuclease E/G n=1 Tax=Parvularcula marina TaxID=2292771 RepID=UPI0035155947
MSAGLLIEETPLSVRIARVEDDEVTALRHWFPGRADPMLGALYRAKVTDVDKRLGAVYLDLGRAKGFLRRSGPLPDVGRTLIVEVKRETIGTKGADVTDKPVLRGAMTSWRIGDEEERAGPLGEEAFPAEFKAKLTPEGPIGLIDPFAPLSRLMLGLLTSDVSFIEVTRADTRSRLAAGMPSDFPIDVGPARGLAEWLDAAEEEALDRSHDLPGGGRLIIEETEALFAVDLDLGSQGGQSKKGAGTKLLGEALSTLGRIGGVMGLGGQIIIDVPRGAIAAPKIVRDQITRALKPLGRVSVPAVTPEGLCTIIAPRPRPSLREILTEPGTDTFPGRRFRADVIAAKAFRAAERALEDNRTSQVTLFVTQRAIALLDEAGSPMHDLTARFGPRLRVESLGDGDPHGDFHVKA